MRNKLRSPAELHKPTWGMEILYDPAQIKA